MTTNLPPVRRQIELAVDADRAWTAITAGIGDWWPLGSFGCSGDAKAGLAFDGDDLVETGPDGTRYVWGSVLRREAPHTLVMTWHPGRDAGETDTEVEFRVTALGLGRSRVEVLHRGWERLPDPAGSRTEYDGGWPTVLDALGVTLPDGPEEWFVLAHSPGPTWVPELAPGKQPGIEAHWAFMDQLRESGNLVAAGPLPERPGHGQMVVRGLTREQAAEHATQRDGSVVSGLLGVTVIPWLVVERG